MIDNQTYLQLKNVFIFYIGTFLKYRKDSKMLSPPKPTDT